MNICGREVKIQGRLCRTAHLDADDYKFLDDPEAVLGELRKSEMRIDLFTFVQRLPETIPKHTYPMEWDNVAALKVSTFEHWWSKQIRTNTRNKARRAAKKGVVIREVPFDNALARGIWEIYNECPVRQERRFPHYGKSLEAIREMSATYLDSSFFIGAYLDDKLIGFIKLTVDDTGTQAGMMHILTMIRHREKAAANALVAQAVRSCAERHIPYLVWSRFAYGKKTQSSLSKFKEESAFERVDIPQYFVPLTRWGSFALSMKLHRRLYDRLPEPLAAKLRELRSAWYQSRFQLPAKSL
jgi:Acetyltransferase (GNAT) family